MPAHRHHTIIETDEISRALRLAAVLWPELNGKKELLLGKILEAGIEQVSSAGKKIRAERLVAIEKLAGSLSGVWPSNWRADLANDWPS